MRKLDQVLNITPDDVRTVAFKAGIAQAQGDLPRAAALLAAVNAMLLNEFLKEHKRVEEQTREINEQKATISELKNGMGVLAAQLKEQAAQIQKVNAQLEMRRPMLRVSD